MSKISRQTGFTLIELMIVVGIMAGIATIAIPSYRSYVMSSRTAECINEVAAIRLGLEEFFLANNFYVGGTINGTTGVFTLSSPAALGTSYTPSQQAASATTNCIYNVILNPPPGVLPPGAPVPLYQIDAIGVNNLKEMGTVATFQGP